MKDIFEDMQVKIGCPFISDLPGNKRAVWSEMRRMALEDYSQEQLEDFSRYVFGMKFSVLKDVMALLEKESSDGLCTAAS